MHPEKNVPPDRQFVEILKRLDRIERKLSMLNRPVENKPRETWVGVSIIQELTGWDANGMRKAREKRPRKNAQKS